MDPIPVIKNTGATASRMAFVTLGISAREIITLKLFGKK
jgi:hypothetical protein